MTNSLLKETDFPLFSSFNVDEVKPAIDERIQSCRALKETLLAKGDYTWQGFIAPIEAQEDKLSQSFSPVGHLNAVKNNEPLREAYQYCIEKMSEYSTQSGQDKRLFNAYQQALKNDKSLDMVQKKIIKDTIRDFELSGVNLSGEKREQFERNAAQLSKLQSDFDNNVLDATMAWHYHSEHTDVLMGLPDALIERAKQQAQAMDKKGFVLGLYAPTYIAVMQQAQNRKLREAFYHAYTSKASSFSQHHEFDNAKIMQKILKLREAQAKLIGFANYAQVSVQTKMARSIGEIEAFLNELLDKSKYQAEKEFDELSMFAKQQGLDEEMAPWDVSFYSEKLKKSRYNFTAEELRAYFPLPQVMGGLFSILNTLYGVQVKEIESFDRYDDDTAVYAFYDKQGAHKGKILVDLFARRHKRDGAWMDECRTRYVKENGQLQAPVAYVTCNFMPATQGEPALLTHTDVLTLFHEFGHALHHILTEVDYLAASGINGVEWDAVELPSQFMENFCWSEEGLKQIAEHYQTGEALPEHLFKRLVESRKFQSGLAMLRQLEFSLFDIKLHQQQAQAVDVHEVLQEVRKNTALVMPPEYNRFENSFSHIFAGGYSAGYYSYKWAEVLSSDAFALFEESGNILDAISGEVFLSNILQKGGSKPAAELFKAFRNREPQVDALLRHHGIESLIEHES